MQKLTLLTALISGTLGIETSSLQTEGLSKFMKYVAEHGKSYQSIDEFTARLNNFNILDKWIEEYNANPEMTSTVGHNQFSDFFD